MMMYVTGFSGKSRENGNDNGSCIQLNVNEEYKEVFRTNSYAEICSSVQRQLSRTNADKIPSSSSLPMYIHLSNRFLEQPHEQIVASSDNTSSLHSLLINYFDASLEAYNICQLILRIIHKTRSNNCLIRKAIRISEKYHNSEKCTDGQSQEIIEYLSSFALLNNPISNINSNQFDHFHNRFSLLLHQLTSSRRKIKRRKKLIKFSKKVFGFALIISCSILAVSFLILTIHSFVGMLGAPGLMITCLRKLSKMVESSRMRFRVSLLERLSAQLDLAAKGVYILMNDFDTIGRLAKRLHDEVEHRKSLADMCVRNENSHAMLEEAVREMSMHESGFLEQLKELEEHVYLCFLTMNRSRRLVFQEITGDDV
ncbi:hypothetical protein Nepgr_029184 [Nepenthes gracilis]|uniref:Uncharacterized protein n=1 Tax=Nepenthes gracilis TaxID=150966 RepID=A0AAD3TDP4_NEPGR|nr:hypothetical protein Nepgr_029184 [Nepenthes gracilis]